VPEPYDEAVAPIALAADRQALADRLRDRLGTAFRLDPMPRVIAAEDWQHLKVGLAQRAKALNAFVADAYGPRRIVKAGLIPARVIKTAGRYEPAMRGAQPPGGLWIGIAALDLVRASDGEFLVLADDVTTPGGFAYAEAARQALLPELDPPADAAPRSHAELPRLLASAVRAASPRDEPYAVVLEGGWEQERIAEWLGAPLVAPADLWLDGDRLRHGEHAVDVVHRRSSAGTVDGLLAPAAQAGTLGVLNALGCGIGDDRLAHAYVEDMVRFYLGEEPRLRSVQTLDLARADHLERALDTFGDLVIKPRTGHDAILVCPHAERDDVAAMRDRVREAPREWVAQPFVEPSRHPTVVGSALTPRPVDLRAFVFMHGADHPRVLPGGLTRFERDGIKDTWVLGR
jgi:uncharacterized circularly permuted ATP-grasp superfamily protein